MKVIVVTNTELNALLERLELRKHPSSYEVNNLGMTEAMFDSVFQHFRCQVVRWIQEVGGEIKR